MNRFWFASLSLSCCLLAAAIWTSSGGRTPPADVSWEAEQASQSWADLRAKFSGAAGSTEDDSRASHPEQPQLPSLAVAPTLATPIDARDLSGAEREPIGTEFPSTQPLAELVASDFASSSSRQAIERTSAESRVSVLNKTPDPPLPAPEPPTSNLELGAWELSPQELQVANSHLSYGKTLARKGATASGRSEFLNALAVIAQSRDLRMGGKQHVAALNLAVLAITEADDFYATSGSSNLETDVAIVSAGHLSRILTRAETQQSSRAEALAAYHRFASEQLQLACGENWLASETFHSLGRLHSLLGLADLAQQPRELTKSITFHQAALRADSKNFASANELGVLLARQGQLDDAKRLLLHSLSLSPRRETWTNLATVHQRLGEARLAQLATSEAKLLAERQERTAAATPLIRMVAPAEFDAVPDTQDAGPAERPARSAAESQNSQMR